MIEKFTAGEWVPELDFAGRFGQGVIECSGFYIAVVCGTNYGHAPMGGIDRSWGEGYETEDIKEHEANANLIAKAPEMYRMLKQIADDNRGLDDGFVKNIDDLLARARGE